MFAATGQSSETEDKLFPQKYTLQINGRLISLHQPMVMGIVNLTPDSFFEDGRTDDSQEKFELLVDKHVREGADILDLGGYSTRPGALEIPLHTELDRVLPAVTWIRKKYPDLLISVDTFRSKVAEESAAAGAHLINDISSGELDPAMLATVGKLQIPYIAMHMRGNPQTMQQKTGYSDIIVDIMHYFAEKLGEFKKFGIKDVIIDPGFGFAKTIEQNYHLLKNLRHFKTLSLPILVGVSRKSMVYKTLGIKPAEALNGSTALHMVALIQGANLLRVHDVKEAKETLKLFNKLYT